MDTVSALVAELDVTEESLQGTGAPATAPSAAPAAIVPGPCSADKSGKGKAPAADKAAVTVYRRDGKPSAANAAPDGQLKSKLAAGKKAVDANTENAAATQAAAEDGHAEDHSPSNSRPTRQRGKAQPYWMGGAAPANSPAPREAQAESDNPMPTCQEDKPQPADAQQPKGNGTRTGKAKKAPTVAKRQTRTSPHKEQQQQQPAKRSRAASKQQQNEEQLQHEAAMEDAAEAAMEVGAAAAAAVAGQVPEQPAKAADETVQAGSAETACTDDSKCAAVQQLGTAEDRELVHQRDAVSQTAAVAPNRAVVVELQMLSILLPQS